MNDSSSEKLLQQIFHFINLISRERHKQDLGGKATGINHGQGHLLGILLEHDGLTQKELSIQLQIRPASLGELVGKLEQNNYVQRRINEHDKRVSNVYLTEKGREVVKELVEARNSMVDTIFSGLLDDEKNQLLGLMGKLVGSIEENSLDNTDDFNKEDMIDHNHHGM